MSATSARRRRSRVWARVREGVLRHQFRMPDGYMRSSVYFSILADEWPAVKARLEERLAA